MTRAERERSGEERGENSHARKSLLVGNLIGSSKSSVPLHSIFHPVALPKKTLCSPNIRRPSRHVRIFRRKNTTPVSGACHATPRGLVHACVFRTYSPTTVPAFLSSPPSSARFRFAIIRRIWGTMCGGDFLQSLNLEFLNILWKG